MSGLCGVIYPVPWQILWMDLPAFIKNKKTISNNPRLPPNKSIRKCMEVNISSLKILYKLNQMMNHWSRWWDLFSHYILFQKHLPEIEPLTTRLGEGSKPMDCPQSLLTTVAILKHWRQGSIWNWKIHDMSCPIQHKRCILVWLRTIQVRISSRVLSPNISTSACITQY